MGVFFIISAMIYSVMLNFVYHSKKHISSGETTMFSAMLGTNLVGLILELLSSVCGKLEAISILFATLMTRFYLLYLMAFLLLFTLYIYNVCYKNDKEEYYRKLKKTSIVVFYLAVVVLIFLPITFYEGYAIGRAITFVHLFSVFSTILWLVSILKNFKKVKGTKFVPVFLFMLLMYVVLIAQKIYPTLAIMAVVHTFIIFIMYFTIDDPDVELIQKLNASIAKAEKAKRSKAEFLLNMSHEIRTPLNAIVGFSNSLLENVKDTTNKEDAKYIVNASQNLLDFVNEVMDVSKIDANKMDIVNSEYEVYELFDSLVEMAKERIGDKNINFRFKFDETTPKYLYGDASRLKQVCLNLLTNSIKYTNHGFIEFKVDSIIKDDVVRLIISVEDSGVGIKKENIDKLFVKFSKVELEKNVSVEGTGLGLAITKKLVDMMNGKIIVQSEYGIGSKFMVALDQGLGSEPDEELSSEKGEMSDLPALHVSFDGKKILIIDDNHLNLKVAERVLNPYNVDITLANSGEEGIEYVLRNSYDLVLLDDVMPNKSGVETLREIKAKLPGYATPTVVLTANAATGMKEKYLEEGFDEYVAKPIEKKELERILNKFLK